MQEIGFLRLGMNIVKSFLFKYSPTAWWNHCVRTSQNLCRRIGFLAQWTSGSIVFVLIVGETSLNWESLYLEFFNIDSQMHFLEALWVSSRSVGNVFRLDAIASLGLRACFKRPIIKIAVLDHFQERIWWIWLALSHQGWVQDRLAHFAGVLFAKGGQGGWIGGQRGFFRLGSQWLYLQILVPNYPIIMVQVSAFQLLKQAGV